MTAVQRPRYHPAAWTAAVLISATAWAGYFSLPDTVVAVGALLSAIGIVAWIAAKCAAWLQRRTGESLQLSLPRAISFLALIGFVSFSLLQHGWALSVVYPDP